MDQIKQLFSRIESVSFKNDSYAINTLASFTAFVRSIPEFSQIIENPSATTPEITKTLRERILRLQNINDDINHVHPYDAAIAAYIYAVNILSPAAYSKLESRLVTSKNMWWTIQMVQTLGKINDTKTITEKLTIRSIQSGQYRTINPIGALNSGTQRITKVYES